MFGLNYASVVERYYTRMYALDVMTKERDDMCVMFHSNRVCVITLAPSHPLVADKKSVSKVDFRVTDKTDRMTNSVSGKTKRGAQFLTYESPLCRVTCDDGVAYTLRACFNARLLEVNENLLNQPGLLTESPETEGYIAIAIPTRKNDFVNGREKLISRGDYLKVRFPDHSVSSSDFASEKLLLNKSDFEDVKYDEDKRDEDSSSSSD